MEIRQEEIKDYEKIYEVIKKAFESAEHSDGNEQELVLALRKGENYINELSLVAQDNGEIIGYIMFSKAKVGDTDVLALAPLAVLPEYQNRGIGTALIKEGHKIAKDKGYGYSVVLGSEKYYPRLGYIRADAFGIKAPFEVPSENFMVYKINDEAEAISGILRYAKEFCI